MIPALIGAGTALTGILSGAAANDRTHASNKNAQDTLAQTKGYADQMRSQGQQVLNQMLAANQGIYGSPEAAALALQQAQQGINAVNPYEAGEFSYDKAIEEFYDPALQLRMNAANDAVNQSQAVGGSMFSSDTADKLVAQAQVLGSQAYRDALNAYQTDKSLEQSVWQGNEAAKQAAANSAANLAQMRYNMASDTVGNLSEGQNAYYNALLGLNDDYWQNKTDYIAQLAALKAQDPGKSNGLLSTLGGMFF